MSRSVLAMMLSDIRVTAAFKSNGKNVINASWNATSAVADENSVEGARSEGGVRFVKNYAQSKRQPIRDNFTGLFGQAQGKFKDAIVITSTDSVTSLKERVYSDVEKRRYGAYESEKHQCCRFYI